MQDVRCMRDHVMISSVPADAMRKLEDFPETNQERKSKSLGLPLLGNVAKITQKTGHDNVSPFAEAGIFGVLSFSWLNELMKKGKAKSLEDVDIPCLRREDQAAILYSLFKVKMGKQNHCVGCEKQSSANVLWSIILCQRKAILVSAVFALIKIVTMSSGPLFLYAFIKVAEGRKSINQEAYTLTLGLFFAKCLESVSERQWFFRARLIGIRVKSVLTAAIYEKQLWLSSVAKSSHSAGEIMNYVTVDAHKVGEFPYWFHQIWTTGIQIVIALIIIYYTIGLAMIPALILVILSMLGNSPVAKLQHKYLTGLMVAQDRRLKAIVEALTNMKVLKLYAWENHFKNVIQRLRVEEFAWLSLVQAQKGYYMVLFWSSPIIVSAVTFWACYLLEVPLNTSNVFTFLATLRILQEPIRAIPDVLGVLIEAKVSFARIVKFLEAPELKSYKEKHGRLPEVENCIVIDIHRASRDPDSSKSVLEDINLSVKVGQTIAICGEVGAGKSTLLAAILGELPCIDGTVRVHGKVAYVSQSAWIQTGTIQENILFGSAMNRDKYHETLEKCCLVKDFCMLPFGDETIIGERGVNLSGGQRQRVQLARALYQDADIYLLDDPFSALDAHTATHIFNGYIMEALYTKTVLLVTHQVDFLPSFDLILLLCRGKIIMGASYDQMMNSSQEFQDLVQAHGEVAQPEEITNDGSERERQFSKRTIDSSCDGEVEAPVGEQIINKEERETGNIGLKPYIQYLCQSKGFLYLSLAILSHFIYMVGQLLQSLSIATSVQESTTMRLVGVYSLFGCGMTVFLLLRAYVIFILGLRTSDTIFSKLMISLFRAPMSYYDSTPLGRIFSRVSSDLSAVDLDVSSKFSQTLAATMTAYFTLGILAVLAWPIIFIIIPAVYVTIRLQKFYIASAKELMRIDGTTKSCVASHLAESIAGAVTIRAFQEEDQFTSKFFYVIDKNAASCFYSFSANEWLSIRLELLCAIVLSSSALAMTLLPFGAYQSGFVGMALSYALTLNVFVVHTVRNQCMLENSIVSVERLEQYMHIPSEAPEVIESNRPPLSWPSFGRVDINDLEVRYTPNSPWVLRGISCTFEGGQKVGIVGRTGSGKTTLINVLFRLVEATEGTITIDDVNISTIGLHDLRSCLSIIPQDPVLFGGSVRYNLDPLSEYTDSQIWEVLKKCQLHEAIKWTDMGLNSLVVEDGLNWSMGQRQLFCLGRALLKRRKILVLDEATASVDNATDSNIQETIRTEFAECTLITVAHRIPTVMDCSTVLVLSDGKLVEYDTPMKLMNEESSLFAQLVREYWYRRRN